MSVEFAVAAEPTRDEALAVSVGDSRFVADSDLPSDHFLWLTGQAGKLLRGEIEPTKSLPAR